MDTPTLSASPLPPAALAAATSPRTQPARETPGSGLPSGHVDDALLTVLAAGTQGRREPLRVLLQALGSGEAVIAAGPSRWRAAGADAGQVAALLRPDPVRLRQGRDWLAAAPSRQLLHWADPDYPPLLRTLPRPPLALWVEGDAGLLWRPAVALVGSRAATASGRENAQAFAAALGRAGLVVTSGLARGIDAAAHTGALEAGAATVAVVGTGCDVAYPPRHAALQARIAAAGAVVSEYWPGSGPLQANFPQRNRIIAGLSLAVLVVEAAQRSGALITARLAGEAGREVLALPGSIHSPQARGCLQLLRDGARLAASPEEVLQLIGSQVLDHVQLLRAAMPAPIQQPTAVAQAAAPALLAADPDYKPLWSVLDFDPTPMDKLVERSGLTVARVSAMLALMELEGHVHVEHGRYSRKR